MTGRNGDHIDWEAVSDGGRHVIPHDQMWGNLSQMRARAYRETFDRGWICTVAFTWEGIVIHPRGHPQGYKGRLLVGGRLVGQEGQAPSTTQEV